MRIPRVHVERNLAPGVDARLPDTQAHHVARVLRLGVGNAVVLFNGDGHDYAGSIVALSRDSVEVRVDTRLPATPPSPLSLTLVQGLSRGERMDYSVQKATELGVRAIQPLVTARCEVRLEGSRLDKRLEHWRRVVVSACEQCGRADLPELRAPVTLDEWTGLPSAGVRLMLDPSAERTLASVEPMPAAELVIGPEGGLEERECQALVRAGVVPVRLGPRTLRTETAGPAAIAVLQTLAGDFA